MTDEQRSVETVQSLERELLGIYERVYEALKQVNRAKYKPEQLNELDGVLEDPSRIETSKAIAILKCLCGSTGADRMQLESFYSVPTGQSVSVGDFIQREWRKLGLGYHDFWSYLRLKGWAK